MTAQLATSGQHRSWMSYIRDFGRWLRSRGHADAYVLSGEWKAPFVAARPYLLTDREIEAFFTAAARLDATSPWRWQAVSFFILMHSLGLRTGEARGLLPGHVDLSGRHVDVMWSKGNRSRRLPITGDVCDVLAACDAASTARFGPSRKAFFISSTGNPVTPATVGVVFTGSGMRPGCRARRIAGVPGPTISGTTSPTPTSNGG